MVNQLKEYTGTGASGGNSTDGNNIPSPRPFVMNTRSMDTRSMDTSVMNNQSSSSIDDKSDVDSDGDDDGNTGENEEKEFINKEVPEGLEVAEIEGLHISETLGQ